MTVGELRLRLSAYPDHLPVLKQVEAGDCVYVNASISDGYVTESVPHCLRSQPSDDTVPAVILS